MEKIMNKGTKKIMNKGTKLLSVIWRILHSSTKIRILFLSACHKNNIYEQAQWASKILF